MCSLIDRLCVLLKCPPSKIADELFDPQNMFYLTVALSEGKIRTRHLPVNRELNFCRFSAKSADEQFAYCGYLNITVRQDYYAKYRIMLRRSDLPCVEEWTYDGQVTYFPLEVLSWTPTDECCPYSRHDGPY